MNNNYFSAKITIKNSVTNQIVTENDIFFTIDSSMIELSLDDSLVVETSDKNDNGEYINYQIFKKFDREVLWDFGDGTKIKGTTAKHYYTKPGLYFITCTCFDADGVPYKNIFSKIKQGIPVVDILNTTLAFSNSFINNTSYLDNVQCGEIIKVAELVSTLDKQIINDVPVKCLVSASNSINLFEIKDTITYEHLIPLNSFYNNANEPIYTYMPLYNDVYVLLNPNANSIALSFYIIGNYNQNIIDNFKIDASIKYQYSITFVNKKEDIPHININYIGKVGIGELFYKDDRNSTVRLNFVLNQDYFPDGNNLLSKNIINLIPIGIDVNIKSNNISNKTSLYISTNGLESEDGIFNFNKAIYKDITTPFIIRLKEDQYFAKDYKITQVTYTPNPNLEVTWYSNYKYNNTLYSDIGAAFCSIKAITEGTFDIQISVTIQDTFNTVQTLNYNISNLKCIDLTNFTNEASDNYLNPKQKTIDINPDIIWESYKTVPSFNNTPNLDEYFLKIFKSNDLLNDIVNKGYNFVDDIANIKTCNIKNLISTLDSIDINIDLYNNDNFSKPSIINELLKIISINHSVLVGNKANNDDINSESIGGKYNLNDKIYIPEINSKLNYPMIVVYDKFNKTYMRINTGTIDVRCPNDIKTDDKGKYFQLIDYKEDWGWPLLFKDNIADKLSSFYEFYEYLNNDTGIVNSYLNESTINNQISDYSTWIAEDGSIDRLIYKTLIQTLNLNK